MFGKLMFWKHDDFDFDNDSLSKEPSFSSQPTNQQSQSGFNPSDPLSSPIPQSPSFNPQPFPPQQTPLQQQSTNRDLELVAAKLDALRVTLESMNQRLTNLERIAQQSDDSYETYRKRTW